MIKVPGVANHEKIYGFPSGPVYMFTEVFTEESISFTFGNNGLEISNRYAFLF